jgi:hypothetical protein
MAKKKTKKIGKIRINVSSILKELRYHADVLENLTTKVTDKSTSGRIKILVKWHIKSTTKVADSIERLR